MLRSLGLGRCLCWKSKIPYVDRPRKSSIFGFQNCEWYFELVVNSANSLELYMKRQQGEDVPIIPFDVIICLMMGEDNELISSKTDTIFKSEKIWSRSIMDVKHKVRNSASRRIMQFTIIFDDSFGSSRDLGDKRSEFRTRQLAIIFNPSYDLTRILGDEERAEWQRTQTSLERLSSDLGELLKKDDDSHQDVRVQCGDEVVKAHRNILCARSPVFRAMLQNDMAESRSGLIEIRDMEESVFPKFLQYLYTGKLPEVSPEEAKRFYEVGDEYEVEGLMRLCASVMIRNLSSKNACEVLTLADTHADQLMKEAAISYMIDTKLPLDDDQWMPFSDSHPKLALEVLNQAYKRKV